MQTCRRSGSLALADRAAAPSFRRPAGAALFFWLSTVSLPCAAHEALLREFVAGYNQGNIERLMAVSHPDATENGKTRVRDDYIKLFAASRHRQLVLRNIRWSKSRITADYHATVDQKVYEGSVTFYVRAGKIERIYHDLRPWPEDTNAVGTPESAVAVDTASTAAGLASGGYAEGNPLRPGTVGGAVLYGVAELALRQKVFREAPLSDCIDMTRALAMGAWLGGGNNLLLLAGAAAPAAVIAGLIMGIVAYNQDYKSACTDGPVRITQIGDPAGSP